MKLKIKGVAIDLSGNEQEVDVFLEDSGMCTQPDGSTRVYLEDHAGHFDVRAIPGRFNPWGPTDASVLATDGEVKP